MKILFHLFTNAVFCIFVLSCDDSQQTSSGGDDQPAKTLESSANPPDESPRRAINSLKTGLYINELGNIKTALDSGHVDWKAVRELAETNLQSFRDQLDHLAATFEDQPEIRDEIISTSISRGARHLPAATIVSLIEEHAKGSGKAEAYSSLLADLGESSDEKLRQFAFEIPNGSPSRKGGMKSYFSSASNLQEYEALLSKFTELEDGDRNGARLGLAYSGAQLVVKNRIDRTSLEEAIRTNLPKELHFTFDQFITR